MKSWRTSLGGLGMILSAVGFALKASFDNDPSTVINIEGTIAAISGGLALLFARDNKVSSEDAGAK